MQTVAVTLVTIVAEKVLAKRLTQAILAAGATGYTLGEAGGVGSRNMRASTLDGENIRIEVLAGEDVADALLEMLARDWFPHYAVVAWTSTARVVRGEKYAGRG
jgi:nitrogen regulatory protein P-II 2